MQVRSSQMHGTGVAAWAGGGPRMPGEIQPAREPAFSTSVAPKAQPALVEGSCDVIHLVVPSSREKVLIFLLKMSNHLSFCYLYELPTAHIPLNRLGMGQGITSENHISPVSSEWIIHVFGACSVI